MVLCDVNVLVYAFREESEDHLRFRAWVEEALSGDEPFAVSELVLSGFLRVVTNSRVFKPVVPSQIAFAFAEALRGAPSAVAVAPGSRHWDIFRRLCEHSGAKGNLVADAYLAALAIESGCEWITTDRDYARFQGLRWRHPLEQK
ncbi:MAG: type II toxin-antitoxin system VapC family toxin [Thermoanaerobaculia bacterium]